MVVQDLPRTRLTNRIGVHPMHLNPVAFDDVEEQSDEEDNDSSYRIKQPKSSRKAQK